ncbi:MAG: single-strand binding protein [Bacteroidetes bacterium]|nr:single-strand binding protein [Bacteroidota bacterium]
MSINKAILVGNVGKEPEVRYLEKNVAVANFTLATTERGYTMQNGTQVPDRTEWHNVVAWRNLAEIVEKYVHKGTQVYVEGKIQTRSWEKDGVKRYTTEIYAETIQLLGKRPEQTEVNGGAAPAAAVQTSAEPPVMGAGEDDLPF